MQNNISINYANHIDVNAEDNQTNLQNYKKVFIQTYGCQMNEYDSNQIMQLLHRNLYTKTENYEDANLIILNTCHIREKAAEKVYSELGRIRIAKKNNNAIVVVAGCVAQAEGEEIFRRAPYVDIVIGSQSYSSLPEMVNNLLQDPVKYKHQINLNFLEQKKFDLLEEKFTHFDFLNEEIDFKKNINKLEQEKNISQFISVQEGCDKFCAFCVVPFTRGGEFSRPVEKILREIMEVVSWGAKEVVLLGQNVNAYHGKTFDGKEVNLAFLINKISEIKQIERIRFTTSHPIDMDDDLINLFGSNQKLMPFLNLPVQSGSNNVLKLMNRKYTKEKYLEIIEKLKIQRPDIAMSSDFIVGFPGESDEDFLDTIDIVKKVGFAQSYSFKYSTRPGTPAVDREQVPENIKTKRLAKLQKVITESQYNFNQKFIGKVLPVLFDRVGKKENQIMGKTPYMQSVYLQNASELKDQLLNVKIVEVFNNGLRGELVE